MSVQCLQIIFQACQQPNGTTNDRHVALSQKDSSGIQKYASSCQLEEAENPDFAAKTLRSVNDHMDSLSLESD